MSYGYGIRKPLAHYVCSMCGEEFNSGDRMYTLDDGNHVCDYCIDEYIDKYIDEWKDDHGEVLDDPVDYTGVADTTDEERR